jgi:hypothetical protein
MPIRWMARLGFGSRVHCESLRRTEWGIYAVGSLDGCSLCSCRGVSLECDWVWPDGFSSTTSDPVSVAGFSASSMRTSWYRVRDSVIACRSSSGSWILAFSTRRSSDSYKSGVMEMSVGSGMVAAASVEGIGVATHYSRADLAKIE